MKNMRIPIFSALGVAILGIILGSFLDFQLSSAIASPTSTVGLLISVIGPTIGFSGLAFVGGGLFAIAIKEKRIWVKCIFIAFAVIAVGVTVYYAGREYFGINGFYQKAPDVVGLLIAFVCACGAEVGGYFVFKDTNNAKAWIPLICVYAVLFVVLIAAIPLLKDTMHRPRFRLISRTDLVAFHNWYERCPEYEELIEQIGCWPDDFKSFPSGHTGEAAILIVIAAFAPLANDKLKKYQLPLFIGACVFVAIVGLGRIMAAAHFLSDVSMGATLTLIFTCVANEILIKVLPQDEAKADPKVEEPIQEEAPAQE